MNVSPVFSAVLLGGIFALNAQGQSTNELPALIPPYGTLPPTFWAQYGTTLMVSGLVGVAIVGLLLWLAARPRAVRVLPPEVAARRALEALRTQPENGTRLSQVSQIVRRYFCQAFSLPAGELTTQELIGSINSSQACDDELRAATARFLEACDACKFAPPPAAPPPNAVAGAFALIDQAESVRAVRAAAALKSPA